MKALGVTSEEQVRDFFPPSRRRVTETADEALPHTPFPSTPGHGALRQGLQEPGEEA